MDDTSYDITMCFVKINASEADCRISFTERVDLLVFEFIRVGSFPSLILLKLNVVSLRQRIRVRSSANFSNIVSPHHIHSISFLLYGQSPHTALPILRAASREIWVYILSYKAQIRTAGLSACALFVRFQQSVCKRISLKVSMLLCLAPRKLDSSHKRRPLFIEHFQGLPQPGSYKCHREEGKVNS